LRADGQPADLAPRDRAAHLTNETQPSERSALRFDRISHRVRLLVEGAGPQYRPPHRDFE
jgi:hypothetical protein